MRVTHSTLVIILVLCSFDLLGQNVWPFRKNVRIGDTTQVHVLETLRGDRFIGLAVGYTTDTLLFAIGDVADTLAIAPDSVRRLRLLPLDRLREAATGFQQAEDYFYLPSGFPPRSKFLYRNTMVLLNEVEVQISKHFRTSIGLFVPAFLAHRLTAQGAISDRWRVFAGFNTAVLFFEEEPGSHLFTGISYGTPKRFGSMGFGYFIDWQSGGTITSSVQLAFSAPINKRWRFYTESYLIWENPPLRFVPTGLFSYSSLRHRIDFGVAIFPIDGVIPIPLAAYRTYF